MYISLLILIIIGSIYIGYTNTSKIKEKLMYQNSDIYEIAILLFLLIILIVLLYFNIESPVMIIFLIVIFFLLIKALLNIQKKYSNALNELDTYQSMYQNERLLAHEYRNNLSIIKSMNSDDAVDQFINEIISYKEQDKNGCVPIGCLKSIVDMKSSEAREVGVVLKVRIEKCFNSKKVRQMNNAILTSVAHITAIALDNAIYASTMSDKKVLITVSTLGNNLNIIIVNHFTNNKRISKNHGFGNKIASSIALNHHIMVVNTIRGNTYIKEISANI